MNVNVVAATGRLGTKVMQALLEAGNNAGQLIVSVRSPEKAKEFFKQGVEVRYADYNDPASLTKAFRDSDVLLLIPTFEFVEPRIVQHFNALQAARKCRVGRVIDIGFAGANPESKFMMAPYYLYAESKTRLCGLDWTIVRNGMYLDPVADWVPDLLPGGRLPYPVDHGKIAYISRDDIAGALAAICLTGGHSQKVYTLTGPKAVSMSELAAAVAKATGKPFVFRQVSEDEFADICRADGTPEEVIELFNSMYRAVDAGEFETVTDHVRLLTGTPPQSVEDYMAAKLGPL